MIQKLTQIKLLIGTVIAKTTITAMPSPIAASIFFEIAMKVHIPRKTDKAKFSIKIALINIFK